MTGDRRKCQADLALRGRAGRAAGHAAAPAGTRHQPPGTRPGPVGFYGTGRPPAEGRSRSRRGDQQAGLALHERAGFRAMGTRERIGRHNGQWRDVVLVERRSPVIS